MNNVELRGVIVHKYETEKVVIVTLATSGANHIVNYPTVTFFKQAFDLAEFKEKDHVTITGNMQSSVRRNKETGKTFVIQSIFGESIKNTPRALAAFGVENTGRYLDPFNEFAIEGEVVSVKVVTEDLVIFRIKTNKNNRHSFVKCMYFTKDAKKFAESIEKGSVVCGIGSIQTGKRVRKDGATEYFENTVLKEISKK